MAREVVKDIVESLTQNLGIPSSSKSHSHTFTLLNGFQNPGRSQSPFPSLLALANEKINTLPFHAVQGKWLNLYVDATIGIVVEWSLRSETSEEGKDGKKDKKGLKTKESQAREMVRLLDMAIIVAGGVGPGRMDMIQTLISECQVYIPIRLSQISAKSGPECFSPPAKRRRLESPPLAPSPSSTSTEDPTSIFKPLFAPNPIPTLAHPPSINSYLTSRSLPTSFSTPSPAGDIRPLTHPFILRSHTFDWPAVQNWSSAEYMLDKVGRGRVVPVEVGRSYTDDGWGQKIMCFEEFMTRIGYPGTDSTVSTASDEIPSTSPLYLAQHPLLSQFPQLQKDIILPDYVYSSPSATDDMPDYKPPGNEEGLVVSVWVGSGGGKEGGVVSPAHTDPYYNCYSQVLGHKRIWVAPPCVTPNMYAFPPASTTEDEDLLPSPVESSTTPKQDANPTTSYTTNTSQVPIFSNSTTEALRKFPKYYSEALSLSMEAVLGPGDMMVMPPGWWHAMRGEGEGVVWSVSMWY